MGAQCAPTYASLVFRGKEREIFAREDLEIQLYQLLCWHMYIEDVLVFWTGGIEQLHEFMTLLYQNTWNLKFTYTFNSEKKIFLDLIIIKDHESKINMTLFRKNTAGNTILCAESAHVPQFIASIPYGNIHTLREIVLPSNNL